MRLLRYVGIRSCALQLQVISLEGLRYQGLRCSMSAVVEHCAWGVHDEVQWGKPREKPLENQAKSNRSVSNTLDLAIQKL